MREIKFRGKRIDNGEWVYGYFVKDPLNKCRIYYKPFDEATSNTYHFVAAESVCQLTGLADSKGEVLYEWDIIRLNPNAPVNRVIQYNEDGEFIAVCSKNNNSAFRLGEWLAEEYPNRIKIGNIFDNPKLLK